MLERATHSCIEGMETRVLYAVTTAINVGGQLVVTGDDAADTVNLSHVDPGTTAVNGQFFNEALFPNGVVINAGGGDDTVNVFSNTRTVTVDGQDGINTVNLGQNNNAQGIVGAVFVQDSGGGSTTLSVNSQADTASRTVSVVADGATGVGTVTGLTPGTIHYADVTVNPILQGGGGSDTFTVNENSVGNVVIGTGAGDDTINVQRAGSLTVSGDAGTNKFNVGLNGSTQDIHDVFLSSSGGLSDIVMDDSADTVARAVTLGPDGALGQTVKGLSAGNGGLHYDEPTTKYLTVRAGSGGNTVIVAASKTSTRLETGSGNDVVNVQAMDAHMTIDQQGGSDSTTLGLNGSVQSIRGDLFVEHLGNGFYDLNIDDSADTVARNVSQSIVNSTGTINGLAPGRLDFHLGLRSMTLSGGSGGNTFTLDEHTTDGAPTSFGSAGFLIKTGAGADTVNVLRTLAGMTIDQQSGPGTVNVGMNNSVQGIKGNLFIEHLGSGDYTLAVNDSADTTPRNVTHNIVNSIGTISGLAPALIKYHLGMKSLAINAGSGGNTFTLDEHLTGTPAPSFASSTVTVNSGLGVDKVNVLRTFTPLVVNGQSGTDTVDVGFNGVTTFINAPLTVTNLGSRTGLTLNDQADTAARNAALSVAGLYGVIAGLAPAPIIYVANDVTGITVNGGSGGNTFTVQDTVTSFANPVTTLNTGTGSDTVNVQRTTGALTVNGQSQRDTVNVGVNGSMQSIKGTLNVTNVFSFSAINLNDQADPTGRTVTLNTNPSANQGSVSGLSPAPILYRLGDLSTLTVNGGAGADTFTVGNTASNGGGPANTVLNTGAGDDSIKVAQTTGPLTVNTGPGSNAVAVGANPFNTLDLIQGAVTVNGQDFDALTIIDNGSTTPHVYTQTPTSLSRSGAAPINFSSIEILTILKGPSSTALLATGLMLPASIQADDIAALTDRAED